LILLSRLSDKRRDKVVEEYEQALRDAVSEQFTGVSGKLTMQMKILPEYREQIQKEATWLQSIVGDGVPIRVSVVGRWGLPKSAYGQYEPASGGKPARIVMNIAKPPHQSTFSHEYGHHIEASFPELMPLSRRVQDVYRNTHKNTWMLNYAARKRYAYGGTEVVSVGVGRLYRNPLAFKREEPNHFEYTLGVLSAVASKSF